VIVGYKVAIESPIEHDEFFVITMRVKFDHFVDVGIKMRRKDLP
jgi:hypothetical protein